MRHTLGEPNLTYRRPEKSSTQILEKIRESLDRLNEKMDVFIEIQKHNPRGGLDQTIPDVLDVMTLLSLPDHLRKTAVSLCKLGQATAEEVAEQTKRARAVESGYLNQLMLMGYVKKERKGRKAYFYVEKEEKE
jgi:DNA-binding transcriptional ArsR family regulator